MVVNGRHWKVHSFCDAKWVQSTQQQTETGWGSISPLDCWRERSSDVKSGKMNKRSQSRSFLKISWCIRFWWYIQMAVKDKQKICVWNCGLCSAKSPCLCIQQQWFDVHVRDVLLSCACVLALEDPPSIITSSLKTQDSLMHYPFSYGCKSFTFATITLLRNRRPILCYSWHQWGPYSFVVNCFFHSSVF